MKVAENFALEGLIIQKDGRKIYLSAIARARLK